MPDEDDRFSDVAEQLKQTEKRDEAQSTEPSSSSSSSSGQTTNPDTTSETEQDDPKEGGPPFSFDETDMHGFYVRGQTWDRVTRLRSSVTAACSVFDLSEFESREFQDACLQVVANHADEVALQILQERGIEANEERIQEVVEMLNASSDE